ncbi:MAG: glycosyltransferase, partial [Proteobacteria bacterium]|nr:glycosyltransferase [Pseudomonadota bacterium]
MKKPLCTVIIVSHNNFAETTGPCLQSLNQDNAALEIIVVDNDSDQQTQEAIRATAEQMPRIRVIQKETNSGYSGGNN